MNRNINIIGQQLVSVLFILAGGILLLWFCWPMIFKGIVNVGNICGSLGSCSLLIYGICNKKIHQLVMQWWLKKPVRICLEIAAVVMTVCFMLMIAAAAVIIQAESKNIPENTPAVVLGCSVKGSRPSRILQERIDAAYSYLQKHPQAVCVLSGGRGKDENISEAECMYEALQKAGIEPRRLYKEEKSTNTQENLEYSKRILDNLGIKGAVTIISNEFHLYRGRFWADVSGYKSYGYRAATDWRYLPTYFLREIIAVIHLWSGQFLSKLM